MIDILNQVFEWVKNGGSFTDWMMVLLSFIVAIPVLISLNIKFNWIKTIILFPSFVNRYVKVKVQLLKIKRYLNSISGSNELDIKFAKVNLLKNILIINSNSDSIDIPLSNNEILLIGKFNLSMFKNSLPVEFAIFLFDKIEIISRDRSIKSFVKENRLSEYLHSKYYSKTKVPHLF